MPEGWGKQVFGRDVSGMGDAEFRADIEPFMSPLAWLGYAPDRVFAHPTNLMVHGVYVPKSGKIDSVYAPQRALPRNETSKALIKLAGEYYGDKFSDGDMIYKNTFGPHDDVLGSPDKQKQTYAHEFAHGGDTYMLNDASEENKKRYRKLSLQPQNRRYASWGSGQENFVRLLDDRAMRGKNFALSPQAKNPSQLDSRSFKNFAEEVDEMALSELARTAPHSFPPPQVYPTAWSSLISWFKE